MSARREPTPSYLLHEQSGRGRAVWTDATGTRQQKLLPGNYDSQESRTAFARLQLEIALSVRSGGVSVNEVSLASIEHAEQHYRAPDGLAADEVRHVKAACRHVRELYGAIPASDFGPFALTAVRERVVAAGCCRKTVNARVERVRRVFRWAVAEELVPPAVHHARTSTSSGAG